MRDDGPGMAGRVDEGLVRALTSHRHGLKESEDRTRELEEESQSSGWSHPPIDLKHSAEVIEVFSFQNISLSMTE